MSKIIAVFLCVLLVLALGYVAYAMIGYSRIDDLVPLDVCSPYTASDPGSVMLGQTYTVMSYNVGFGAYTPDFTFFMDGGTESRARSRESVVSCIENAAAEVISHSPDFVFFQEVDTDSDRAIHVEQRNLLKSKFLSDYSVFACNYHSVYLLYPFVCPHGASDSGILTFSRYPVASSMRRSLPISTSFSKFLDLDRCYSVSRVPVENGRELVLYNVHLSAYGGSPEIRTAQMTMLLSDMEAEYEKGNYCVCGGDFNHDFTGDSTQVLNGGATVEFGWAQPFPAELLPEHVSRATEYSSGTLEPTCRNCDIPYEKGNTVFIVDGFLVSDNVKVVYLENVQTDFLWSDHNPVLMQFILEDA